MPSSMHLAWCEVRYRETILQGSTTRRKERKGKGLDTEAINQNIWEKEHKALLTKLM
jgi:hypothetical protein